MLQSPPKKTMSQPSLIKRLVETDHGGRVLYVTPEAGHLFAIPVRELSGRDFFRLFATADARKLRTQLRTALVLGHTTESATAVIGGRAKQAGAVQVTAVRLDARRVQWQLVPTDESGNGNRARTDR
jgi:hypothetical protein